MVLGDVKERARKRPFQGPFAVQDSESNVDIIDVLVPCHCHCQCWGQHGLGALIFAQAEFHFKIKLLAVTWKKIGGLCGKD